MKKQEAKQLGERIAAMIERKEIEGALDVLTPLLDQRIPFSSLDRIGEAIGMASLENVTPFLEKIASKGSEGGWPVIGCALGQQLERDRGGTFDRCRGMISMADIWYAADILAERVPGPALVDSFPTSSKLLKPWAENENRWVRRAVGVAVHFWAKRSRGVSDLEDRAQTLLDMLVPLFEEREMDAVKGIGWGLKTLGKYYPHLTAQWLCQQVTQKKRSCRATMLRKALTYLSPDQRAIVMGDRKA